MEEGSPWLVPRSRSGARWASPPAAALLVLALVAAALLGLRNASTRIRKGASV